MDKELIELNGMIMGEIIDRYGNGKCFLSQNEYLKVYGKINRAKKNLADIKKKYKTLI